MTFRKPDSEYKESLKQNWLQNSSLKTYTDQFGFTIKYGIGHTLLYKDEKIIHVYSLQAAKLISTIILNDKIMNMEMPADEKEQVS